MQDQNPNTTQFTRISRQNQLLFAAGVIAVITGLFLPAVPILVDLLIVFSLSLTCTVTFVCFSSKKPAQLNGFALLAITAVAAQLTTILVSVRTILSSGSAGTLVTSLVQFHILANLFSTKLIILIFTLDAVLTFILIHRRVKSIRSASADYLEKTDAAEMELFDNDFDIVDKTDSELVAKEKGFFFSTAAFARFSFWAAFAMMIVIVAALPMTAVIAATKFSDTAKTILTLAVTATLLPQMFALVIIGAAARLVRRNSKLLLEEDQMTEEQFHRRIKVTAREIAAVQADQYYLDNATEVITVDVGEPVNARYVGSQLPVFNPGLFNNDASYDALAELLSAKETSTLLTASHAGHLPVTIAVNTAIRLARAQSKILIIDFDLERSAVAQVFDIADCKNRATKTCIDNIWLISGEKLAVFKREKLQKVFEKLDTLYDHVIIYAPQCDAAASIMPYVKTAVIFKNDEGESVKLRNVVEILNKGDCKTIKPSEILQAV